MLQVIRILEKLCINPTVISDVIPSAENVINGVTTSSSQPPGNIRTTLSESHDNISTMSHQQNEPTVLSHLGRSEASTDVMDEDMYVSSFDFIRPPFASTQLVGGSQLTETSHMISQNNDLLVSVEHSSDTLVK